MARTVYVVRNLPDPALDGGSGVMEWRDEQNELPTFDEADERFVVTVPARHADDDDQITHEFDAFLGEYELPDDYECGPIQ